MQNTIVNQGHILYEENNTAVHSKSQYIIAYIEALMYLP